MTDQNLLRMILSESALPFRDSRIPFVRVAVTDRSITFTALLQHGATDHIKSMKDTISLAGTAHQLDLITDLKASTPVSIFVDLDSDTENVNVTRSTMVSRFFMTCLGKNEHLGILKYKFSAAASYTMIIAMITDPLNDRCSTTMSSMYEVTRTGSPSMEQRLQNPVSADIMLLNARQLDDRTNGRAA